MTAPHPEIIVVRRRGSEEDAHHGGAWKIAFADFMTAMMAFFLVLWIISATDKNTKTLIARYFNPVKVEEPAKAQKGIHGVPEKDALCGGRGHCCAKRREALFRARRSDAGKGGRGRARGFVEPIRATAPAHPLDRAATGSGETLSDHVGAGIVQRSSRQPRQDRRRAAAWASHRSFGGDERLWRSGAERRRSVARSVPSARQRPGGQCGGPRSRRPAGGRRPQRRTGFHVDVDCVSGWVADGLRRSAGTRRSSRRGSPAPATPYPPAPDAAEALQTAASNLLADLKKRLAGEAKAMQGPELDIQATEEGILISLTDRQNFSMFAIGSAEPQPRVVKMMEAIAASLRSLQGPDHRARTHRRAPLPVRDLRQLAALLGAGANGLLHADLRPSVRMQQNLATPSAKFPTFDMGREDPTPI